LILLFEMKDEVKLFTDVVCCEEMLWS
jgi:hypothetical protein